MEVRRSLRMFLSFKNATVVVCLLNLIAALILFNGLFSSYEGRAAVVVSTRGKHIDAAQLKFILESEQLRLAMKPLELIKRVHEIEQEGSIEHEHDSEKLKNSTQTAAVDLSKRLKDLRSTTDANSQKALEEWMKRKMDRARQREIEKNSTLQVLQA